MFHLPPSSTSIKFILWVGSRYSLGIKLDSELCNWTTHNWDTDEGLLWAYRQRIDLKAIVYLMNILFILILCPEGSRFSVPGLWRKWCPGLSPRTFNYRQTAGTMGESVIWPGHPSFLAHSRETPFLRINGPWAVARRLKNRSLSTW